MLLVAVSPKNMTQMKYPSAPVTEIALTRIENVTTMRTHVVKSSTFWLIINKLIARFFVSRSALEITNINCSAGR